MDSSFQDKRVAVYARYSSDKQRDSSIEDQVERCRQTIERRGGIFHRSLVFSDRAESGTSLHRNGFEALMRAVESTPRTVDVVVAEDQSRIARDMEDSASLFKRFRYAGVSLVLAADGIDTSTRDAKMTYHVKSLMADMYIEDLRDKTRRGMNGRASKGMSTGGLPFGYKSEAEVDERAMVTGYRITIDDEKAAIVRRVFSEYVAGLSYGDIAGGLNRDSIPTPRTRKGKVSRGWVTTTVRAFLENEFYVGSRTFGKRNWIKVPGTNKRRPRQAAQDEVTRVLQPELRIIDQSLWDAVQARRRKVRAIYTRTAPSGSGGTIIRRTSYLLSGLRPSSWCNG